MRVLVVVWLVLLLGVRNINLLSVVVLAGMVQDFLLVVQHNIGFTTRVFFRSLHHGTQMTFQLQERH